MVDIAQSVEHLIVVQEVACSSHVIHPGKKEAGTKVPAFSHSGPNRRPCSRGRSYERELLKYLKLADERGPHAGTTLAALRQHMEFLRAIRPIRFMCTL